MDQFVDIVKPLSLPLAIAGLVLAGIVYLFAKQMGEKREVVRVLKSALDRDPSPAQIGQALNTWPEAKSMPPKHQLDEVRRLAREYEAKQAHSFEVAKGLSRFFLALMVLGIVLFIVSVAWTKWGGPLAPKKPAIDPNEMQSFHSHAPVA